MFSKFCINNSKNINIIQINGPVNKSDAHIKLNIIKNKINNDTKNHCLKLDKTWYKYTLHLKYIFLKKYKIIVSNEEIHNIKVNVIAIIPSILYWYGSK